MIQGGGLAPGMKQKPTRAPIANEAGNGLKNKRYTVAMARTSASRTRPPRNSSSTSATTTSSTTRRRSPQGWGYCVFGKVIAGTGRRRQDQGRGRPAERLPPERAARGRDDRARRGSRGAGLTPTFAAAARSRSDAADAVRLGPAPRARAAGAGSGVRSRSAAGPARRRGALYVLGDLFDAWIGDDQLRGAVRARVARRAARSRRGRRAGVRDARQSRPAAGRALRAATGARHCSRTRSSSISHGTPTLLLHGDELCTDDAAYQRYRAFVHDPGRQRRLLALPYCLRRAAVAWLRRKSRSDDRDQDAGDHGRQRRGRRRGVHPPRRPHDDPRPHAPARRGTTCRRRRRAASAWVLRRLARPRAACSRSTPTAARPREAAA